MNGTYDTSLVILSMAVALMASYVALDLASRVTAATTAKVQLYWLIGGAIPMGIGIWSMHFIGMLAFRMPIPMSYDIPITLLSLLIATVVSGLALYTVSRKTFGVARVLGGGALMGIGIASMHYTGMAAMQMQPPIRYDPFLFTLSILIAVAASIAALWTAFQLRSETILSAFWRKAGSAVVMGAAICGMHYTGMAAAVFAPNSVCTANPQHIDNALLAETIGVFTIMWLATTLLVSIAARLAERTELSRSLLQREALERTHAESALEKERQFLAALLENLADGIVACDEHGVLTLFNRATREFHGLPERPMSPDKWAEHYDLCLPDGHTPMTREQIPLLRAFVGEAVRNVEMVIAPKNRFHPRRTVVCNGGALVTASGKKLGAVVAMRDITANKRMEDEIRTQSVRLAEAQRIARVGSWDWNFALDQIAWSDDLYRIFGIQPREFGATLESFFAFVHPEDLVFVRETLEKAISQKKFTAYDFRIVRPDGEVRVIHADGDLVADQPGKPGIMMGIAQDITERKGAEDALRISEERFQLISRATNDTVWDWNLITNEQWWSDQFQAMFGYPPEDIENDAKAWITRLHPDDLARVTQGIHEAIKSGLQSWSCEYRFRRADGAYALVLDRAYMVRNDQGEPVRMLGTMMDITARKRMEEELKQARDQALDSARTKSEFLANMSHEIRTPLNGVIGMSGLLLNTRLSPSQRHYAETVQRSGESLLMIINDILDFSKIEAGMMRLEIVDFDLNTIFENTASLLAGRAHAKKIELAIALDLKLPTALKGDPYRLNQILTNLASNAIKFTEQGEVVLRARAVAESSDAVTVRFEISDTGIGLSPEQQARLFKAFSQADNSTTRKYGGTGLGLAICAQLVELMDGEIGVRSEAGKGSVFWFTAPLARQAPGAQSVPPSRMNLHGLRVLILDDNATNRFILHEQVAAWHMLTGSAESGPRALELLRAAAERNEPYDLAILDMQMPDMDGLSVARAIKADPRIADTALIMLTSMGHGGVADDATDAGIAVCLSKPARLSELYDWLGKAAAMRTASQSAIMRMRAELLTKPVQETVDCSHLRILVAEDNVVNQQVAVGLLEAQGYRVDTVVNGLEAVEAVLRTPYDAVFMDCQMPEMDGYTAATEIRKREVGGTRRTPIIALTAHALAGEREKCLAAGMDDYVAKPVRSNDLYAALGRWMPGVAVASEDLLVVDKTPAVEDDAIDPAALANLRKMRRPGKPDMLGTVIELYLTDTPPRLAALRDSATHGFARDVARIAHTLKGSSANLGARRMVALCAELETLGEAETLDNVAGLLGKLEAEFQRARNSLQTRVSAA